MERGHLWRSRWAAIGAAVAVTIGVGGVIGISHAAPSPSQASASSSLVPLTPLRIFDSRPAPANVGGFAGPLGADSSTTLQVTGVAGVPSQATAVVLNVSVTGTTAPSFLTVWPADKPRPTASNLNWTGANVTVPNLVTVSLSADGKINFYNLAGTTHVFADIAGYYLPAGLKTVDLNIFSAHLGTGASIATGFGATAIVDFSFVIPNDYTAGTPLTVNIPWHTSGTACIVSLRPSYVSVGRPGQVHIVGIGASDGLTSVGGNNRTAPTTANLISLAQFTLTSPLPAQPLQPGDNYIFGIFRAGASDTCATPALLDGITVSYS